MQDGQKWVSANFAVSRAVELTKDATNFLIALKCPIIPPFGTICAALVNGAYAVLAVVYAVLKLVRLIVEGLKLRSLSCSCLNL